jgi:hypothetical protein
MGTADSLTSEVADARRPVYRHVDVERARE